MNTGQRVREHYINQGLSRRAYAARIGVTEQALRRLEAGFGIHPANAKVIADDLGVRVTDLLPQTVEAA